MNNTLLPCPFCGGEAKIKSRYIGYGSVGLGAHDWYSVECKECRAKGYEYGMEPEAIAAWNQRAQPWNEPLTVDEMNALDHEPIYVLHTGGKWTMNGWHIATASSYQNHGRCDLEIDNGNTTIDMQNYGKTWLAYRHKPKEEHHETD